MGEQAVCKEESEIAEIIQVQNLNNQEEVFLFVVWEKLQ